MCNFQKLYDKSLNGFDVFADDLATGNTEFENLIFKGLIIWIQVLK